MSWNPIVPSARVGGSQAPAAAPDNRGLSGDENFLTSFVAFAYGSDPEGRIVLDGGEPIWRSQSGRVWIESAVAFNSNRPAGYWMVNTGNPTRDAIATIAMNELGFDNFRRMVDYKQDGRYMAMAREAGFGTLELALGITGVGKFGQALVRAPKAFRTARMVAGQRRIGNKFTQNQPGGFLNRTRTALFGGQYVDPKGPVGKPRTKWVNGQRVTTPGGPIVQTRPNAFAAVAQRYKDAGGGLKGVAGAVKGTVRSTARAIASGAGAAFPKGKRAGRLGLLAAPLAIAGIGASRMRAGAQEEAQAATENQGGAGDDSIFEALAEAAANAQQSTAGIQAQYNNIFRELQSMYNLAETEMEKERLRFMLADIEAQRDAGLQAIATGYADTAGRIRERAVKTQAEGQERAGQYADQLSGYAGQSEQRMIDQQAMQVAANRGLGIGAGVDPMNEWNRFQNVLPDIQRQYTGRMADITSEGINWMADTVDAQGLAQQAELQRLAASTRSGTIASHQAAVASRIAREQAEQRDALMRLRMAGLSGAGSPDYLEGAKLWEHLLTLGASGYSDQAVSSLAPLFAGRALSPTELAAVQYERSRIPMSSVPGAATNPLDR